MLVSLLVVYPVGTSADGLMTEAGANAPIRVLAVTATQGYRHGPAIAAAQSFLTGLNGTSEFDFVFTENLNDLERLADFQVLFFANSTLRLAPEPPEGVNSDQQAAIIEFLNQGGGFVGAHSALDACYGWAEYRKLVGGGLFRSHPWTEPVRIVNEAPGHPITAHLGSSFELTDEIYLLDHNPRPNVNVLLRLDPGSVDLSLLPTDVERHDFPISWTRTQGASRIFMTKLGHFPEVWLNPDFQAHLLQGLRYAAGRTTDNHRQENAL